MIRQESPVDLKSGYPCWAVNNGQMHAFPQLDTGPFAFARLKCH